MVALTVFTLSIHLAVATAYIWPSPQLDALEALRFDLDSHPILQFIDPCDTFNFGPNGNTNLSGRSNTADWIRTAYHDMATHDAAAGTGGMDASIRFPEELGRDENVGTGFNNTLQILLGVVNRYVSIADALTLGATIAIENCNGPQIAFRGGRIDATKPNAPGVPEPQQDLPTHIRAFARQGLNQKEMIGLIACGHSFGGVQHVPFPQIVPEMDDPTNTESVAHFDSTSVTFDNNVATEYISGRTQNPLVVGLNQTTNSDKRIFGSDKNVTMKAFAKSLTLFASTCATLFAKMFDSVPKGVKLTEVLAPLPVKPANMQLVLNNGTLQLSGQIRLWNAVADPARTVRLAYAEHGSTSYTHKNITLRATGATNGGRGASAAWYTLSPPLSIPARTGISRFRVEVDGKVMDQGGRGFAFMDDVVLSRTSCLTNSDASSLAGRVDVAVRTGTNPARVYLEREVVSRGKTPVVVVETDIPRPSALDNANTTTNVTATATATNATYAIWSLEFDNGSATNGFVASTLGVETHGGVKSTRLGKIELFGLPPCAGS
ncbi:heme peroxidase [Mycena filopes]|nr:heme peroxidase [Mycena filopes]